MPYISREAMVILDKDYKGFKGEAWLVQLYEGSDIAVAVVAEPRGAFRQFLDQVQDMDPVDFVTAVYLAEIKGIRVVPVKGAVVTFPEKNFEAALEEMVKHVNAIEDQMRSGFQGFGEKE